MKDYYKILQVDPEASLEVLNGAYRSLVKRFHPDQFHTNRKAVMTERMREINEAYQILSNPSSRSEFDRQRQRQAPQAKTSPPLSRRQQLKSILLWSLVSYTVLVVFVKPMLGNPLSKILILTALGLMALRIYQKQQPPKS